MVDDQDAVRRVAVNMLEDMGYRAISADSGRSALRSLERHTDVTLLFSDVVMPDGMDGVSLARQARERWPDLKILLASGFPKELLKNEEAFPLLSKPYQAKDLARAIRSALEREETA